MLIITLGSLKDHMEELILILSSYNEIQPRSEKRHWSGYEVDALKWRPDIKCHDVNINSVMKRASDYGRTATFFVVVVASSPRDSQASHLSNSIPHQLTPTNKTLTHPFFLVLNTWMSRSIAFKLLIKILLGSSVGSALKKQWTVGVFFVSAWNKKSVGVFLFP